MNRIVTPAQVPLEITTMGGYDCSFSLTGIQSRSSASPQLSEGTVEASDRLLSSLSN